MKFSNRLILDEEQELTAYLKGAKITTSHAAGSFGFSSSDAEADVIELRHQLDTSTESVFITRRLFNRLRLAFQTLNVHRARVRGADREYLK